GGDVGVRGAEAAAGVGGGVEGVGGGTVSQRIPDWVLERHLVGDALPAGFTEADLAADPSVPERLEKLKASDAEILERHPPRVVAAQVRARAEERGRRARRPMMVLLPVALAGVAAVVIALP